MKITKFQDIPQFTRDGDYRADYPIHHILGFIDEEVETQGLQLNPDFQRGHVWTQAQQQAFIEFFFKGGKTGRVIYLNNPSWHTSQPEGAYNDYVCVDGLQRLTAIRAFFNNEFPVFGSYYREFTDKPRFANNTFTVNVNDLKTRREVLQWYIDFNSGGTVHSQEEIDRVRKLLDAEEKRGRKA